MGDLFAKMKGNLGGDINKIRTVGLYMVDILKALGIRNIENKIVSPTDLQLIWESELIDSNPNYWKLVLDIAMKTTDQTAKSSIEIMGIPKYQVPILSVLLSIKATMLSLSKYGITRRPISPAPQITIFIFQFVLIL